MKRSLSKGELAFWIVLALAVLVNFATYIALLPAMPDQLPSHWGVDGVDDWNSKEASLAMAALPAIILAVLFIVPRIDPKGRNFERFSGIYRTFVTVLTLFMMAISWAGPLTVWGYLSTDGAVLNTLLIGFFGLLFIVLGNYLPRVKPNFTFGIRTPWTLASEEVWRRTHRASGPAFIIAGIATFIAALFASIAPAIAIGVMLVTVLGATAFAGVYSYLAWRKLSA
ncbi:SdpI family protein [Collinsella ihumii]|uniref:SdpI family protein n=1 Tax=Collinsella ihumii TaxID=1720204 RepID=A0ABT7XDJ5_9ACTN|nr:SdpI family protein [Collinsella ihumii]MCF6413707.1 SdpI family protein [Collinsella tanakaei]MDN0063476.1 SdpI family protein [Collinsella ihumii]